MTGIILQVRLDSSRLPEKALLPLGGKGRAGRASLTARVMEALLLIPAEVRILATEAGSAPKLGPIAKAFGFELFVGPKDDVLGRFCQAARNYSLDRIIRATGDNPLVSWELARLLLDFHASHESDCSGFVGMPLGMGVEIVEVEALLTAEKESSDPYDREHVTPYIRRRTDVFKIDSPEVPEEFRMPKARVTVDTASDFERAQAIFAELWKGGPIPASLVMEWLRTHPG